MLEKERIGEPCDRSGNRCPCVNGSGFAVLKSDSVPCPVCGGEFKGWGNRASIIDAETLTGVLEQSESLYPEGQKEDEKPESSTLPNTASGLKHINNSPLRGNCRTCGELTVCPRCLLWRAVKSGSCDCYVCDDGDSHVGTGASTKMQSLERARTSRSCPDAWAWWRKLGNPRRVLAPMVDHSDLPFRLLCREYGAELCYTPMIHARMFLENDAYSDRQLPNFSQQDRPLLLHFNCNDPDVLQGAIKKAEALEDAGRFGYDGIDINFGCPQGIAKRGMYGAFLLDKPDLMVELIKRADSVSRKPVTVKVRLLDYEDPWKSVLLIRRLVDAGAALVCVHGRTRIMKSQLTGRSNWDALRTIKAAITDVPVIGNGGVETWEDALRMERSTEVDAVMVAVAALEYPPVFQHPMESSRTMNEVPRCILGHQYPPVSDKLIDDRINQVSLVPRSQLVSRYLHFASKFPPGIKIVKAHLFKMLHGWLQERVKTGETDLRPLIGSAISLEAIQEVILSDLCAAELDKTRGFVGSLAFYRRYRKEEGGEPSKRHLSSGMVEGSDEERPVKKVKRDAK